MLQTQFLFFVGSNNSRSSGVPIGKSSSEAPIGSTETVSSWGKYGIVLPMVGLF